MLVEWKKLAPESKVWIFTQAEALSNQQQRAVSKALETFIQNWLSHHADLKAAYQIIAGYFIVLAAEAPSGCSTDTLFRTIKTLSQEYGLKPLPNRYIIYQTQDGKVDFIDFPDLKVSIQTKKLLPTHIIFDNTVSNLGTFEKSWRQKAQDSWLKRYF